MKLALPLLLLACAALPARAAGAVKLSGKKEEDVLRRFVTLDPRLRAKLDDAAQREEAFVAENRDSDLRDAISDQGPDSLKQALENASGDKRVQVLNRLPGVKPPVASACVTFADCGHPDLSVDVSDAGQLPDAIRGLVRPWMLLQSARGSAVVLTPAAGESGDAVLTATLKGVDAPPLVLNVTPHLLGGFQVWFDKPLELAALYGREREAALKIRR